jgi:methionine aminopeptidase
LALGKVKPGVNIIEITKATDNFINDETKKVFAKKRIEKGIAFPTCISINEICGHFSPLSSEANEKDI